MFLSRKQNRAHQKSCAVGLTKPKAQSCTMLLEIQTKVSAILYNAFRDFVPKPLRSRYSAPSGTPRSDRPDEEKANPWPSVGRWRGSLRSAGLCFGPRCMMVSKILCLVGARGQFLLGASPWLTALQSPCPSRKSLQMLAQSRTNHGGSAAKSVGLRNGCSPRGRHGEAVGL
jgi:hypothetical protein